MNLLTIVLLIKHPSIDPKKISETLGIEPYSSWKAGDPKTTPCGTRLTGHYRESSWNHVRKLEGNVSISDELEKFVHHLASKKDFWRKLSNESARREIFFQLPGNENLGVLLKPELLKQIADIGLSFGFEIFPN